MRGIGHHATGPRAAATVLVIVAVAASALWLGTGQVRPANPVPTTVLSNSPMAVATPSRSPSSTPPATPAPTPSPTATPDARAAARIDQTGPIRSGYEMTGTWAVRGSTLLITTDGGATWRQSRLPQVPDDRYAWSIAVTDADHAWIVGASPESTADSATFTLYRTSDGGNTWLSGTIPGDPEFGVWLLFWNNTSGVVTVTSTPNSGYRGYRTTDGGATWKDAGACQPNAGVTMSDPTTWWASSQGQARMGGPEPLLQKTVSCGRTWTSVPVAGFPKMSDASLGIPAPPTFVDATTGYLAVNHPIEGVSEPQCQAYETTDGGRTWKPIGSATPHWLTWISFADATHWVGEAPDPRLTTVITDDAGKTWREVARPDGEQWFSTSSSGAWFVDALHGFTPAYFPDQPIALAAGQHGSGAPDLAASVYQTLLVTSDGGVTWTPAQFPS